MDIQAAYSCLLGRPWIHEAGAVTSRLHQKLKFALFGKVVTVSGEATLLISHLSNFSHIDANGVEGTPFQGFTIEEESSKKKETHMASFRDAHKVVQGGVSADWGQLLQVTENKQKEGLGFATNKPGVVIQPKNNTFYSAGYINTPPEANAIIEEDVEEEAHVFVIPGKVCNNWVAVDVPSVTHVSK